MDKVEMLSEAVAAIVAALIAAAISSVLAILAKDQKTTEFRQAWIDCVRNDISELVSLLSTIAGLAELVVKQGKELSDFLQSKSDDLSKAQACMFRLRLRLNIKDDKELLEILGRFDCGMRKVNPEIFEDIELLVAKSQVLLKKEWMRVRRGEISFLMVKYCGLAIPLGAVTYCFHEKLFSFALSIFSQF